MVVQLKVLQASGAGGEAFGWWWWMVEVSEVVEVLSKSSTEKKQSSGCLCALNTEKNRKVQP